MLIIVKTWKEPKCAPIVDWTKEFCIYWLFNIPTMNIQIHQIELTTSKHIEMHVLKNIVLDNRSKSQNSIFGMISLT